MNISEYTQYILWGGGALIALVVAHGLWMNWRARASGRAQVKRPARRTAEQLDFEFDPQDDGIPVSEDDGGGEALAANGSPPETTRPGRRIPVAGRRTEPTVPRKDRSFAGGMAPRAAPAWTDSSATDDEASDVIVVWVFAKQGANFDGERLLRVFMANELKYAGNVFRKLDPNTRRPRFTVANGVEPGTFDVSDMDSLATPRLVFLLRLSALKDPMPAFEDMLEVAQEVAVALDGELKDEHKKSLSGQTIEHCRGRIRDSKRGNMRT